MLILIMPLMRWIQWCKNQIWQWQVCQNMIQQRLGPNFLNLGQTAYQHNQGIYQIANWNLYKQVNRVWSSTLTAPRTDIGYQVAMQHWKKFLHSKSQESGYLPNEGNIVAAHLVNMAKKADGDFYSLSLLHQYLWCKQDNLQRKSFIGYLGRS